MRHIEGLWIGTYGDLLLLGCLHQHKHCQSLNDDEWLWERIAK